MVKLRSLSGPPAGEWTASLPLEIVYHVVDQLDPDRDLESFKSLILTCRELKSYCRPIVFHTIDIGTRRTLDSSPPPAEKQIKAFESLRRLSLLLTDAPDIADFVVIINFFWMPFQDAYAPEDKAQCCEAEVLFPFVFDRPFPVLETITINTYAFSFKDIFPGVQQSFLTIVSAPKLLNLFVSMKSFPNALLEQGRHARNIAINGDIYSDPLQPTPVATNSFVTTPRTLHISYISEQALPLLTREHSPRFDTSQLHVLTFERPRLYSAGYNAIVHSAAARLVSLSLRIKDWENSLVFLPFWELSVLKVLDLNVTMDKPVKLHHALDWLNTSVSRRSTSTTTTNSPLIAVILSTRFTPGFDIAKMDDAAERATTLATHQAIWSATVRKQGWPDLVGLEIHGGSEMVMNGEIGVRGLQGALSVRRNA
ncbi:hypothetical protein BKA70DRAFT_1323825 [Coprinopsis sp. MPI-PUGE-AT-0042]|nr:hypothetical protein BKA70DRAFT_1323825 [Coprinopsis sp. MPI-PUGE-AT-0042]